MKATIENLFQEHLGVNTLDTQPLTGGQVGHVFRVRTEEKDYVIKFVEVSVEQSFNEESVDDRVYGSRWSNLVPTYELLKSKNIPTPHLHALGTLKEEQLHYAIFDFLSGDDPDYSLTWFSRLGKEMATIHAITRSYQGWVSMGEPYIENWDNAFKASLRSRLEDVREFIDSSLYAAVANYVELNISNFRSPNNFVLTHTDGIQAVFKKAENWKIEGVIDVEDYQFTDQRFALAGVELTNALQGHSLPESFWQAYADVTPVDESYESVKGLFQVYYLLVWIRVLQGQDVLVSKNTSFLEAIVK